jgi:hypothetical protein
MAQREKLTELKKRLSDMEDDIEEILGELDSIGDERGDPIIGRREIVANPPAQTPIRNIADETLEACRKAQKDLELAIEQSPMEEGKAA